MIAKKIIDIDLEEKISQLIKVIGIGGAGSNAVNYMYENKSLKHVDYIVCNTDLQALNNSPVPIKIQIGKELTGGLGAGSKPETGKKAAIESLQEIEELLSQKTKMLFITAGMGGGTGTGAAPEIAKLAKKLGILTVAIVTMPFKYEGPLRMQSAVKGIEELRKHVDSLLIVDNEKLIEVYGDLPYNEAFNKSDEVLANAVKSVSQVIVTNYHINVDFNDVETILRQSGTALIGTATASGEDRAKKVIEKALESPLLNDNDIQGAKNVLLLIISGTQAATVKEIDFINRYIQQKAGQEVNIIMGLGQDPALERQIAVTVIATGFPAEKQKQIEASNPEFYITVKKEEQNTETFFEDLTEEEFEKNSEILSSGINEGLFSTLNEVQQESKQEKQPENPVRLTGLFNTPENLPASNEPGKPNKTGFTPDETEMFVDRYKQMSNKSATIRKKNTGETTNNTAQQTRPENEEKPKNEHPPNMTNENTGLDYDPENKIIDNLFKYVYPFKKNK